MYRQQWYFFGQVDRGVPFSMGLGLKEQADDLATKEIAGLETKESETREAMQKVFCDKPSGSPCLTWVHPPIPPAPRIFLFSGCDFPQAMYFFFLICIVFLIRNFGDCFISRLPLCVSVALTTSPTFEEMVAITVHAITTHYRCR